MLFRSNAHNFYGDLADLEAATLDDVEQFFDTYYAPNNAALAVVGDIDVAQTTAWIRKYFGDIRAAPQPPRPDVSEPRQQEEQRFVQAYPRAPRPALALGYHAPARTSDEYYALGLIDHILANGRDSRLYQRLVREKGLTDDISSSLNSLGNMFNVEGPTLYTLSLFHDSATDPNTIIQAVDREIARLRDAPIDEAILRLARTKMRSSLLDSLEGLFGFGRADMLASFALFFDDPKRINDIGRRFDAVTPELVQATAREFLRSGNRTILIGTPGAQP